MARINDDDIVYGKWMMIYILFSNYLNLTFVFAVPQKNKEKKTFKSILQQTHYEECSAK